MKSNNPDGIRVLGYVRQSKTDDDESRSLPAQMHAIEQYCKREGLTLIEMFSEPDQSAKVESISKRPVFKRLLEAVARREADAVVVHELSRWSRNIGVAAQAYQILDKAGARLIAINDAIDRTTASGRLFANMMSAIHEFYSENLGEHMAKATSERLNNRLHVGQVPFGWRSFKPAETKYSTEPASVEPDEFEAARRLIIEPFLTGSIGYYDIAKVMNEAGWRTRSLRLISRDGAGGAWTADTVRTYLGRPFIAGFVAEGVRGTTRHW